MRPIDLLAELLSQCARGDERAFARLYRQAAPTLFSLILRMVKRRDWAEEILQEAFVNIWHYAGDYQPYKGTPMTWMTSIGRNRALDWLRRDRPETSIEEVEAAESWVDPTPEPLEETVQSSEARALWDCLRQLEANARRAILLAYYEGHTHEALSRHLEVPLGTVKSWIRRALPQLRGCLET
jgi:RNA polymerase sigma-70 factor, ECF subfamily